MITITGSPKEIAALVDELQERRAQREREYVCKRIMECFDSETSPRPGSEAQSFSLQTETLSEHREADSGQLSNNPDQTDTCAAYPPGSPAQEKLPAVPEG